MNGEVELVDLHCGHIGHPETVHAHIGDRVLDTKDWKTTRLPDGTVYRSHFEWEDE